MPSVAVKCHDTETSLLEGVLSRGDRRVAEALELAWQRGARLDSWRECFQPDLWWQALADGGVDVEATVHRAYALDARLPWDHLNVKKGRTYLEKEQNRATVQLA
ncbi:MAG: B12-binding domain-containing radical SAM protein, partial [Pirellulales bacterium]